MVVKYYEKKQVLESVQRRDFKKAKDLITEHFLDGEEGINDIRDWMGAPLLIKSLYAGDSDFLKWLIEKGADVNIRDIGNNASALHYAMLKPFGLGVPDILLKAGADINAKTHIGETPFDWVFGYTNESLEDYKKCEFLLMRGAKVSLWKRFYFKIQCMMENLS